jgi:2-hydroxy-6-oxonona-2,4-dienedioate hydrolase
LNSPQQATAPGARWPDPVLSLSDVAAIEAAAVRIETPCGDGTLAWRVWGDPADAPVVLLHGGSGSWTHWVRTIGPLLRARRRVCVPDMPGFGESAAPPDGGDADVIPGWLERGLPRVLGDGPHDVVGFSFGALVATLWAERAPERFASLVLVGAPALSAEPMGRIDLRPWRDEPLGPGRDALHRHNLRALMFADDASVDGLAVALHGANVVRDRMLNRRLMLTDAVWRILPTLRCPVSGIWGAQDVLYRDRPAIVEDALSRAPGFRSLAWVPGAGHWVQFEAARAFDAALSAALGGA